MDDINDIAVSDYSNNEENNGVGVGGGEGNGEMMMMMTMTTDQRTYEYVDSKNDADQEKSKPVVTNLSSCGTYKVREKAFVRFKTIYSSKVYTFTEKVRVDFTFVEKNSLKIFKESSNCKPVSTTNSRSAKQLLNFQAKSKSQSNDIAAGDNSNKHTDLHANGNWICFWSTI